MSIHFSQRIQDPRSAISHSTLAGIESGALPSVYKILSLAYCLRITEEQILEWYGVNLAAMRPMLKQRAEKPAGALNPLRPVAHEAHFPFRWPSEPAPPRTDLFSFRAKGISAAEQQRFRYVRIGSQDDCMLDLISPGSIARVDIHQRQVVMFPWPTLWHRPIYLVWHQYGHSCCWCQQNGPDLFLIYHPACNCLARRLRLPRDANIIGRVVSVWSSPEDTSMEFPTVELPSPDTFTKTR